MYAVKGCTLNSETPAPDIRELREKYTYNIYPCGVQPSNEVGGEGAWPMAPLPSRGGSFGVEPHNSCYDDDPSKETHSHHHSSKPSSQRKTGKSFSNGVVADGRVQRSFEGGGGGAEVSGPVEQQIRHLNRHYCSVARQPSHVSCDMQLTPPIARAFCPQQQRDTNPVPYYTAYAADVPLDVIQQSRVMSGFDQLLRFNDHQRDQFVLSFAECPEVHGHPLSHRPPPPPWQAGRERKERRGRETEN